MHYFQARGRHHFNSRTSCEVRHRAGGICTGINYFNSRTSCEVRPRPRYGNLRWCRFQLTHLLRGATDGEVHTVYPRLGFQLTHLLRGATRTLGQKAKQQRFQLTHLLRGATPNYLATLAMLPISTHAPLARCDLKKMKAPTINGISTHAPLARCDQFGRRQPLPRGHFNSRTSCEVRRQCPRVPSAPQAAFQLTHLLRGATQLRPIGGGLDAFQLTHLLRGATPLDLLGGKADGFQLTHLLRGATTC